MLFKTPIWFIVGAAIAANLLQLMRSSAMFDVPKIALWLLSLFAVIWTVFPLLMTLGGGKATLNVGWILGLVSAALPLICLLAPDEATSESLADHSDIASE